WQDSPDGVTWTDIAGATNDSYTTPVLLVTTYYQVIISATGNGCETITSSAATVTVNPLPVITFVDPVTACSNVLPVTLDAGAGHAAYLWSTGSVTQTTDVNASGIYSVTVTGFNSCTSTDSYNLSINPAPTATANVTSNYNGQDISCFGFADGTAQVIPANGTSPFTYLWDAATGNQTAQQATGLSAGTYTVTVTDAMNCTVSTSVVVNEPPQLDANTMVTSNYNGQDISCFGFTDGSAIANPFDGTAPYFYQWDAAAGNQTTQQANYLGAGLYQVTITDINGCSIVRDITLTQPTQIDASTMVTSDYNGQDISCFGFTDGSASATPWNGTAPYFYQWDATAGNQTTQIATNLGAGTYQVTITDNNSCSIVRNITLTQPPQLDATTAVTSNYNGQQISCFGNNDGSAIANPSAGTAPYFYQWDAAAGNQISQQAINLGAGTYQVTITDNNSCSIVRSVTLTQPTQLDAVVSVSSNYNGQQISCAGENDGSAIAIPSNGTSPYTYQWDASAGNQTSQTASNLTAGTYLVTISDINGCSIQRSVVVTEPLPLNATTSVTSNYNGQQISCFGASDGAAIANPTNGTAPYTYNWSVSAGSQTSQIAINLPAGTHFVTVTDINGCTFVQNVTLTAPTGLIASTSVTSNYNGQQISCFGESDGSAIVNPANATPPYFYQWGLSAGGQTTQQAINLPAGTHSVTITDINGCSIVRTVTLTQPGELDAIVSVTSNYNGQNVSCWGSTNGSALASPSFGTAPYTYQWSANAASQTTAQAFNLAAGTYFVTVTDINGCTAVRSVVVNQPPQITANASVISDYNGQDVSCFGSHDGSAQVTFNGGTAPVSYHWDAAAGNQLNQTAVGLGAGTYFVTVTDINGCTTQTSVTLTQPTAVQASAVVTSDYNGQNISCFGASDGSAQVNPSQGTSPYTYLWGANAGNQTTQEAANLPAGNYWVTVTDINGCTISTSVQLTQPMMLAAPASVFSNYNGYNISCFGASDGAVISNPVQGTSPYTYLWDSNTGNQTTQIASGLAQGTYFVTVTDINGCTATSSVLITQPTPVVVQVNAQSVMCGMSLGSAAVIANGGASAYTYQWSSGSTGAIAPGLVAGTYYVTVLDQNGCSETDSTTITTIGNLGVTFTLQAPVSCYGLTDAVLASNVANGVPAYSYIWSNGSITGNLTGIGAGMYSLTVTDSWGCMGNSSYLITQPAEIQLNFVTTDVTCYGESTGTAMVVPFGGFTPYEALWPNGDNSLSTSGLAAGVYVVSVTDAHNCVKTGEIVINQPPEMIINLNIDSIDCFGLRGAIEALPVGGTPGYTYQWIGNTINATGPVILNLPEGVYYLTVTDSRGCTGTKMVMLSQPARLEGSFVYSNPSCIGNHDGSIDVVLTGGTQPYATDLGIVINNMVYIDGLLEGQYEINIADLHGCELYLGPITLTDPDIECLRIPRAFSPNGDGQNDTWEIINIELYPGAIIDIYNRWGQHLWSGDITQQWDGTCNGTPVPTGSYLYVIDLHNGEEARVGTVTVLY
nr:gliding motility-associated C-terminal domain-containing protein [Bacteroidales bacterium]